MICAEIPDPVQFPRLFACVMTKMIHGPCGKVNPNSPCMEDNECNKKFPKDFVEETLENFNGYPHYRRRNTN